MMRLKPSNSPRDDITEEEDSSSRRSLLIKSAITAIGSLTVASDAEASPKGAKGAAEYDLEFYLRDIMKGNTREGNLPASPPPLSQPPRTLQNPSGFLSLILNEECNGDAIPVAELSELTKVSPNDISKKVKEIRDKVSQSFATKSPWQVDSITDEYYFDVTSYAMYKTAAALIPSDYALRDKWVRNVGKSIYSEAKKLNLVQSPQFSSSNPLTCTIPTLLQILNLYNTTNYYSSYRLGEKGDDVRTGTNIFDTYDDDDIITGNNVNCLISLFRPATLGASLQITGEGSRFAPDFVAPTIIAMWEEEAGLKVDCESYFVDPEYRPNPKDFFPDELLLQLTLSRKRKKQ